MRVYLHWAVAVAVVVLFPMAGAAQEQGLRDRDRERQPDASRRIAADIQKASVHRGPFYLLSSIQLADIGYEETNEFWVPTRDHTSGVTFGINAPHRLYFIPRKKVVFVLDAVPAYGFFRVSDEEGGRHFRNQFGYVTRAAMQLLLNHLYLETYGGTSNTLRSNTGEINRILTRSDKNYGINGELKYSSKTSALFAAVVRDVDFPDDGEQPVDKDVRLLGRHELSQRLSLRHKTFPRTALYVAAEHGNYEFKRLLSRDSSRTYGGGGATFTGNYVTATVESGYAQLSFDEPGVKEFSGAIGNARVDVPIGRRWNVNATASRDVDFSIFGDNRYYTLDRVNTAVTYRVSQRLQLRGTGNLGRNRFDVPNQGVLRRDDLSFVSAGFLFSLRRSQIGLELGHYSRKTNIGDPSESGIRTILHLSFRP